MSKKSVHIIRNGIKVEDLTCPECEETDKLQRLFLKKGTGKKQYIYFECLRCACQFGMPVDGVRDRDEEE